MNDARIYSEISGGIPSNLTVNPPVILDRLSRAIIEEIPAGNA